MRLFVKSPSSFFKLVWVIVVLSQFVGQTSAFFPLFSNFINRFRNNNNNHNHQFNGDSVPHHNGVSVFSGGSGSSPKNFTSIRVPMLQAQPSERRIDVVTTVVTKAMDDPEIKVENNVTTSGSSQAMLTSRIVIPTSTSVSTSVSSTTSRVTSSKQIRFGKEGEPKTLTLPFTPNLFGMMSYMQALKDIKRNYKDQEKERKLELHQSKGNADFMHRIMKTLIQKVVNKYQKHTEILKLKILKRQERLQNFLQLPMVSQVIASEQLEPGDGAEPVPAQRRNGGILSKVMGSIGLGMGKGFNRNNNNNNNKAPPQQGGKRFPNILDYFLI